MATKNQKYNSDKEKEITKLNLQLSKIDKSNPFLIPEGYFENLPSSIQEKILKSKTSLKSRIYSLLSGHPKYSISFGFTAILVILLWVFIPVTKDESTFSFADITIEDILDESPELIYYLDESQIIDVILAENEEPLNSSYGLNLQTDDDLTNEDLIEYLNNENYETDILYNL